MDQFSFLCTNWANPENFQEDAAFSLRISGSRNKGNGEKNALLIVRKKEIRVSTLILKRRKAKSQSPYKLQAARKGEGQNLEDLEIAKHRSSFPNYQFLLIQSELAIAWDAIDSPLWLNSS